MCQKLVLINVEDLEAAQTWVELHHLVSDMHGFVISVRNASFYVWQVQGLFPFGKPFLLWVLVVVTHDLKVGLSWWRLLI